MGLIPVSYTQLDVYKRQKVVKRMGYKEDMAQCRNCIAEHLQEELTPAELAERFGYSFYHFCHVFQSVNGMAVAAVSYTHLDVYKRQI